MKAIRNSFLWASLTAWACVLTPESAHAGYTFASFDAPGLSFNVTTVNGINQNGDVVGFGGNFTQFTNFVRSANGTLTTLNIGGDPLANANGINSLNQIVGQSNNNAFLLTNNGATLSFLPPVEPGNTGMESAFGINDKGTIVGQFTEDSTDTQPGFVYSHGAFTVLNPVANAQATNAQGINDNGLVVGFFSTDGLHDHGFLYDTNTQQYRLLADPVVPNLFLTQFLGINDKNEAVGYYQLSDGSQHGFIYDINTSTYTFLDDPRRRAVRVFDHTDHGDQ